MARKTKNTEIKTLTHDDEKRTNIPTSELQDLVPDDDANSRNYIYRRDRDLDPQLVWRGKDEEDAEPLTVEAPPIYIQEHIQPQILVEDLKRQSRRNGDDEMPQLFSGWEELALEERLEFYQHSQTWSNRMILGDSLQVMASLAEKENLRGQVQCIFMDPPYGINFGSNWQTSTKSKTVQAGKDFSREPEVIKAFRDTWQHGINSYLSYIRDRLVLGRDLLTDSGSIFLQIGEENVHLLRILMDEIFGRDNFISQISFKKTSGLAIKSLASTGDYLIWFAKNKEAMKYFSLFKQKEFGGDSMYTSITTPDYEDRYMTKAEKNDPLQIPKGSRPFMISDITKPWPRPNKDYELDYRGKIYSLNKLWWAFEMEGMQRIIRADRLIGRGGKLPYYKRYFDDFTAQYFDNNWGDTRSAMEKIYVVQTQEEVVKRCLLMTTEPGDLVLDPTCGSGTTAYVAEQWGRRWITTDTSRVAIALARTRLMAAHFDYYLLTDSQEGAAKTAEITGKPPLASATYGNHISRGFVYKHCPKITMSTVARTTEIDVIWDKFTDEIATLLKNLNDSLGESWEEWQIPKTPQEDWSDASKECHRLWLAKWTRRQQEIDASIARNAETEYLYDQPYTRSGTLRVTGPFTVESLSPHRVVPTDAEDEVLLAELGDDSKPQDIKQRTPSRPRSVENGESKFHDIILENLRKAGVQNTKKGERLEFIHLEPWLCENDHYIQFEGLYMENGKEKKAAICVGPEYGTVSERLIVQAARQAVNFFDILIVLGFAFEASTRDESKPIGKVRVLRARMNNDLHMADRLKTGTSGNLFVLFGEPDIEPIPTEDGKIKIKIKGIDIFNPTTGDVTPSDTEDIACWFIDTDYNQEAFFVRHAYFCKGGENDPFKKLKTTLKAEVNQETWATLYTTESRPFDKPKGGLIAVKAINHYGVEVLKIFKVE